MSVVELTVELRKVASLVIHDKRCPFDQRTTYQPSPDAVVRAVARATSFQVGLIRRVGRVGKLLASALQGKDTGIVLTRRQSQGARAYLI